MKILQVCPKFLHFAASGSTRVAYFISKALIKKGHFVTVYSSDMKDKYYRIESGKKNMAGVMVYHFRSFGTVATREMKFFITPMIIKTARNEIRSFDVLHMHEYRSFQNIVLHHYATKYNVPYVLQAHGSLPTMASKKKLKRIYDSLFGYKLLRDASKVIALSSIESQQYKRLGVPDEKIVVIPNGIELSSCHILPPKGIFKARHGIDKMKKLILFLGRINRLKGIEFLIDAFTYMIKTMKYDALLVIAGPDDGYLDATKELVKQHKIEDRIVFIGPLFGKEKVEAYVDASIVASLDSLREVVFLLVPLEAAACGTPVIVTKTNYIAELVEKGKFGYSVEYGDVLQLANILKKMLINEDLLKGMGLNGRDFILKNFNWDSIVDMIEEVYENSLKQIK